MFGVIADETKKIARNPRRLIEVFRLRRWRQFFSVLVFNARSGNRWKSAPDDAHFKRREYSSYDEYVRHQQSKFQYLDLADYDAKYRRQLAERLKNLPGLKPSASVLCLGARQGTEVKAFLDLGCFAVGLDLNPGRENKFVLHGDFHQIQFVTDSVDVIFTNSFDHAFDPEKLIAEIIRLLKPSGMLIVEAIHGEAEETAPDHYASFWWQRVDDLAALLTRHGFQNVRRISFEQPWRGEQLVFTLPKRENG
jgi:SAM-dependent methyltransferase